MKAKLPPRKNTYRSYESSWIDRPADPPDVWSHAVGNSTEVYISWNGATEVAEWNVYKSDFQGDISALVSSVPKAGFEISITPDG